MNPIPKLIQPMFGKTCCKTRVWRSRSLRLGFGEKIYHGNPKLIDDFNGEWEIGTYRCAWRIIQAEMIICGSNDAADSIDELDAAVKQIDLGRIISLTMCPSGIDIRAEFDTGISVDFLSTISDDDDCFNVFCPDNMCANYDVERGWLIGKSDRPGKLVRESEWNSEK